MSYHEKQYCHDCIPSYTIISMIPPSSRELGGTSWMAFRETSSSSFYSSLAVPHSLKKYIFLLAQKVNFTRFSDSEWERGNAWKRIRALKNSTSFSAYSIVVLEMCVCVCLREKDSQTDISFLEWIKFILIDHSNWATLILTISALNTAEPTVPKFKNK